MAEELKRCNTPHDMLPAARIALACELLPPGYVVARDGIKPLRPDGIPDDAWEWVKMGWFLHRSQAVSVVADE